MVHEAKSEKKVTLPLTVMTVVDLGRLSRELSDLDSFSLQSSVRDAGKQPALPRTSRGLEDLAAQSDLNLLIEEDRAALKHRLDELRKKSPIIHMSFASDPSPAFLTKLMTWLRNEIHPSTLLNVGLQPGLAAGCIVRTTNKYFDFSLRKHLKENSNLLLDALKEPKA